MIAVIDYGSGNLQAIANILGRLKVPFLRANQPADLEGAEKILLPGVGAFDQAMGELERSGLHRALDQNVLERRKPLLGICVGMQLLGKSSSEGEAPGLGWIDAVVRRFQPPESGPALQLPHMGWNTVEPLRADPLFAGVDLGAGYYFLHSYYMECRDPDDRLAVAQYGGRFTCAVRRENIYGVQFHPEKSHQAGVQLLQNFASL